jgi:hypothetical protein
MAAEEPSVPDRNHQEISELQKIPALPSAGAALSVNLLKKKSGKNHGS